MESRTSSIPLGTLALQAGIRLSETTRDGRGKNDGGTMEQSKMIRTMLEGLKSSCMAVHRFFVLYHSSRGSEFFRLKKLLIDLKASFRHGDINRSIGSCVR